VRESSSQSAPHLDGSDCGTVPDSGIVAVKIVLRFAQADKQ
jgi:hypothetical protein